MNSAKVEDGEVAPKERGLRGLCGSTVSTVGALFFTIIAAGGSAAISTVVTMEIQNAQGTPSPTLSPTGAPTIPALDCEAFGSTREVLSEHFFEFLDGPSITPQVEISRIVGVEFAMVGGAGGGALGEIGVGSAGGPGTFVSGYFSYEFVAGDTFLIDIGEGGKFDVDGSQASPDGGCGGTRSGYQTGGGGGSTRLILRRDSVEQLVAQAGGGGGAGSAGCGGSLGGALTPPSHGGPGGGNGRSSCVNKTVFPEGVRNDLGAQGKLSGPGGRLFKGGDNCFFGASGGDSGGGGGGFAGGGARDSHSGGGGGSSFLSQDFFFLESSILEVDDGQTSYPVFGGVGNDEILPHASASFFNAGLGNARDYGKGRISTNGANGVIELRFIGCTLT